MDNVYTTRQPIRLKLGVLDYINFKDFSKKRYHTSVQTDSKEILAMSKTHQGQTPKLWTVRETPANQDFERKKLRQKLAKLWGTRRRAMGS